MNKKTEVNRIIKVIFSWFMIVIKFISGLISIALFLFIMSCLIDSNKTGSWICVESRKGGGLYFNTQSINIKNDIIKYKQKLYDSETGEYAIIISEIKDPLNSLYSYGATVNTKCIKFDLYNKNDEYLGDGCDLNLKETSNEVEIGRYSFPYNYLKLKYDNYKKLKPLKIAIIVEIILFIIALISIILYYKKKIKLINGDIVEKQIEKDSSNHNLNKEEDVNEEN